MEAYQISFERGNGATSQDAGHARFTVGRMCFRYCSSDLLEKTPMACRSLGDEHMRDVGCILFSAECDLRMYWKFPGYFRRSEATALRERAFS